MFSNKLYQFEVPYNFDKKLIDGLKIIDPNGENINCIYIPPYAKDYQATVRGYEMILMYDQMTREEYVEHINHIKENYPRKMQLILQRDYLLTEEQLDFYIGLGFTKFCVKTFEQAKALKERNPRFNVIGSVVMMMNKQKILAHPEYRGVYDGFVLPFSYCRDIDALKDMPEGYDYVLFCNTSCYPLCDGTRHWNLKPEEVAVLPDVRLAFGCKANEDHWNTSSFILPTDLPLFVDYVRCFKLVDRNSTTRQILSMFCVFSRPEDKLMLYMHRPDESLYKKELLKDNDFDPAAK